MNCWTEKQNIFKDYIYREFFRSMIELGPEDSVPADPEPVKPRRAKRKGNR